MFHPQIKQTLTKFQNWTLLSKKSLQMFSPKKTCVWGTVSFGIPWFPWCGSLTTARSSRRRWCAMCTCEGRFGNPSALVENSWFFNVLLLDSLIHLDVVRFKKRSCNFYSKKWKALQDTHFWVAGPGHPVAHLVVFEGTPLVFPSTSNAQRSSKWFPWHRRCAGVARIGTCHPCFWYLQKAEWPLWRESSLPKKPTKT